MRLCADENIPAAAIAALRSAGHDVVAIAEVGAQKSDAEVLEIARKGERLLITFDKDFGELVFHMHARTTTGIILFRLGLRLPDEIAGRLVRIIESRNDWIGNFSVVTDSLVRQRPLKG